jgi:hypothetical protein
MSRRIAISLLVCLFLGLAVAAFLLLRPVAVVRVTLPGQGERIAESVLAHPADILRMKYIHSVERTPVEGWFAIADKGGFRAVKTKTTGTGTGLPNVVPESRVTVKDDWLVVDEQGKYYPSIPFYYLPLNNLRILVGETKMGLKDIPAGSRIRITSETHFGWKALALRFFR